MEWRTCPSWPDYDVSESGDIRRVVKRNGFQGMRKSYLTTTGYAYIVMRHAGKRMACAVHRLVAEAFIGAAPSAQHQVAHIDGSRVNNHWTNLRWSTRVENEADKISHGRTNRGERFGRVRLTEAQALETKRCLMRGVHPSQLAHRFGVAVTTIKSIKQGRSWAWLEA